MVLWGTIARLLAGKAEKELARRGARTATASRYADQAEDLYDRYGEVTDHTVGYIGPQIGAYADAHTEELYDTPEFLHEPYHHVVERVKQYRDDIRAYLETAEPYSDQREYGPQHIAEPYDAVTDRYEDPDQDADTARYTEEQRLESSRERRKRIEAWVDGVVQDLTQDDTDV